MNNFLVSIDSAASICTFLWCTKQWKYWKCNNHFFSSLSHSPFLCLEAIMPYTLNYNNTMIIAFEKKIECARKKWGVTLALFASWRKKSMSQWQHFLRIYIIKIPLKSFHICCCLKAFFWQFTSIFNSLFNLKAESISAKTKKKWHKICIETRHNFPRHLSIHSRLRSRAWRIPP